MVVGTPAQRGGETCLEPHSGRRHSQCLIQQRRQPRLALHRGFRVYGYHALRDVQRCHMYFLMRSWCHVIILIKNKGLGSADLTLASGIPALRAPKGGPCGTAPRPLSRHPPHGAWPVQGCRTTPPSQDSVSPAPRQFPPAPPSLPGPQPPLRRPSPLLRLRRPGLSRL